MFNPKIISALALVSTIVVVLVYHRGERVRPVGAIGTLQTIATPRPCSAIGETFRRWKNMPAQTLCSATVACELWHIVCDSLENLR
jgi:hypothetical protein